MFREISGRIELVTLVPSDATTVGGERRLMSVISACSKRYSGADPHLVEREAVEELSYPRAVSG